MGTLQKGTSEDDSISRTKNSLFWGFDILEEVEKIDLKGNHEQRA